MAMKNNFLGDEVPKKTNITLAFPVRLLILLWEWKRKITCKFI